MISKKKNNGRWKRDRPRRPTRADFVKPDILREIRFIIELAQAEDARLVRLGNLLLFSTRNRDAWLLDVEDQLALCLCREGEPQPVRIVDTPTTFGIDWTARFGIEDSAFIVEERSGRIVAIHGYPVAEIAAACQPL